MICSRCQKAYFLGSGTLIAKLACVRGVWNGLPTLQIAYTVGLIQFTSMKLTMFEPFHGVGRLASCDGPDGLKPCRAARISFSSASDLEIEEGIRRFGEALRSFKPTAELPESTEVHCHDSIMACTPGDQPEIISTVGSRGYGGLVGGETGTMLATDMIGTC